jgi:Trk K+ transport system NAD-binding subunit
MAGGDLLRVRVEVPQHLVGKPVSSFGETGRVIVAGVERGGRGFIPVPESTFQEGDALQVILHRDAMETLDALMTFTEEH